MLHHNNAWSQRFRYLRHSFSTHVSKAILSTPEQPVIAYADGACRGNPGIGGCGIVLLHPESNQILTMSKLYLGHNETNNTAEYKALQLALKVAHEFQVENLHIHMDSKLIISQMQGQYKVKHPVLKLLHHDCKLLCTDLNSVQFTYVPRAENAQADRLANEAIDEYQLQII